MVVHYFPLFVQMNREHVFLPPGERLLYIFREAVWANGYVSGTPFVLLAAIGIWPTLQHDKKRSVLLSLPFVLLIVYGIVPAVAGHFMPYHYMPFIFFLTMTITLLIYASRIEGVSPGRFVAMGMVFIVSSLAIIAGNVNTSILHKSAKDGRVERIVTAMRIYLRPGDTVHPIDWTDGVLHAMLRLEIPMATPFFYDVVFHHSVDTETIQTMRNRFLDSFSKANPSILVEAPNRERVSGVGTEVAFPAFDRLMAENYKMIYEEKDFRIFRRTDGAATTSEGGQ